MPTALQAAKGRLNEVPGVAKPLLQEAMRGILPEPIRTRRYKRSFNDVFWSGLSRNMHVLEQIASPDAWGTRHLSV